MKRRVHGVGRVPTILMLAFVTIVGTLALMPAARSASKPTLVTAAASPGGTAAAKAARGKELYAGNCATCHKANGAGGMKLGSATSADLRAPHLEKTYHNSDAQLRRAILDAKDEDGESLDPAMPHFRGKLSGPDVDAIIAFLKTLHK